jgi:hypothetical protein
MSSVPAKVKKVKFFLLLIKHRAMKTYRNEGECSASSTGLFIPRKRALGTQWIRGWVAPQRGSLRKISVQTSVQKVSAEVYVHRTASSTTGT